MARLAETMRTLIVELATTEVPAMSEAAGSPALLDADDLAALAESFEAPCLSSRLSPFPCALPTRRGAFPMHALPSKLKLARRQTVQILPGDMVRRRPLVDGQILPLLIEPVIVGGVDLPLWLDSHRGELADALRYHGAILFRGFGLHGDDGFQRALAATGVRLMPYIEKATPREHLSNNVYTSTYFPQEYPIALHNELSYVKTWPGRIFFFCDQPSLTGGETPLADVRRVLDRIGPEIREKFQRLGWQLVRTFGSGMGPTWQHAFDVDTVAELEAYLSAMDISWEWLPNGWLRTRQTRPAIHRHPVTGESLRFNHVAFWHPSSLPDQVRSRFASDFGTENLPYGPVMATDRRSGRCRGRTAPGLRP